MWLKGVISIGREESVSKNRGHGKFVPCSLLTGSQTYPISEHALFCYEGNSYVANDKIKFSFAVYFKFMAGEIL